ncbi:MAG TPA: PP2C family protein-serine/threonine phosphatase [Bacteroidota bacterium]|nr:PP2C family protein-serine/threonine phosphatase [Bacteroidota bacterium]
MPSALPVTPDEDRFTGQLSSRIGILQQGLRRISRSSTLADLGACSLEALRLTVPSMETGLGYRQKGRKAWEALGECSARGLTELRRASADAAVPNPATIGKRGGCLVQRLADDSSVGLFVRPHRGYSVTDLDLVTFRLFLQLFDGAYQEMAFRKNEKSLVFSLNHRILQLNSLIETGIEVSRLTENQSPHHLALIRAVSLVNASRGVVRVHSGKRLREEYVFPEGSPLRQTPGGAGRLESSFDFLDHSYTFVLYNKESRDGRGVFEETDQLLLDALARQVHASMENRYLHEQAIEKERIEKELNVATSIQAKILPDALPKIRGYGVAGVNIPSKSVGGDYYNCFELPDGTYALVVADVAGKGVPAALLVSSLHAYLRAFLEQAMPLRDLGSRLDKSLYRDSTDDKFVTAFIARLQPATGEIEYLNAGHNPAYLLRTDGSIEELPNGGPPLGILNLPIVFESKRITISKGEQLLIYTDGIPEAENEHEEFFETHHPLAEYFAAQKPASADAFIKKLIADVKQFAGSGPQSDDITAIYLRRI